MMASRLHLCYQPLGKGPKGCTFSFALPNTEDEGDPLELWLPGAEVWAFFEAELFDPINALLLFFCLFV